jgi:phospholipid/cholesterol/gamma-HCH transport system substrate-binding protein
LLAPEPAPTMPSAMVEPVKSAKVGILLLFAMVAGYSIYRLVDERASDGEGYLVWAVFEDAQGLVPKSRVLIAGIQVGTIEKIRLWGAQARVDIRMNKDVVLYEDARVAKRSASILGEHLLVIDPGTLGAKRLGDDSRITTVQETTSTDEIMNNVGAVAASVRKVAAQLERVFGTEQGGREMASALHNLTEALESVNHTIQTNEQVVHHTLTNIEEITTNGGPKLERILSNIEAVTQNVRMAADSTPGRDREATIAGSLQSINRTTHELEKVVADIRVVSDRMAKGQGTVGRLTKDEEVADEVEGVVEGVGDFVGGFQRLQTIVNLRSEYYMLTNAMKGYVELQLKPREDKYLMLQFISDPRGSTRYEQTVVRTSPPLEGVPSYYQESRITTTDAFRFSLMFAKRVQFATFRFGILESTGGAGVDLHLAEDRLEINNDFFDFGSQVNPRIRVRAAYEVVKKIWILGGMDDMINPSRDYYLGAQLRFNDEDLKRILPFVGISSAR